MQDQYGAVVQSQIVSDCRRLSQYVTTNRPALRSHRDNGNGPRRGGPACGPGGAAECGSEMVRFWSCCVLLFVHVCQVKFDMDRGNDLSQTRDGQISIWWGPISGCNYARLPAEKKKA